MASPPSAQTDLWDKNTDSSALGEHYTTALDMLTRRQVNSKAEIARVIALHARALQSLVSENNRLRELGRHQASEWDRFWTAMDRPSDMTVDQCIALWQRTEAARQEAQAALNKLVRDIYEMLAGTGTDSPLKELFSGQPMQSAASNIDFEAAMDHAKERGKVTMERILTGPEMLTDASMAALLGVSAETVNRLRLRHELIGLQGVTRDFKYPDWQIVDGRPLKGLPQLHAIMDNSPWAVYRFLLEQHDALDGKSALECLRQGCSEDVLLVAEAISWGGA